MVSYDMIPYVAGAGEFRTVSGSDLKTTADV